MPKPNELDLSLPEPLKHLAADPRVCVRRGGAPLPGARCVVYWMQRSQRGVDNPALDLAIAIGNELSLPVIAFFSAISNFPHANLRHYHFLNQGLPDIEEDLAERNVTFVVRRPPENSLEKLLAETHAAMVIGDENPCREPERWRKVLARRLSLPYWTVDSDVVVPSALFEKGYYALHHFRPKLQAQIPKFLHAPQNPKADHAWQKPAQLDGFPVREDITQGWKKFDRSVAPVDTFTGGSHAALKRLRGFLADDLGAYEKQRNHPETHRTSRMSPYLHFGHISALRIAHEVDKAARDGKVAKSARDSYLDELIGWRELAINFVKFRNADYDSFACAEPWAQKTLEAHSRDRRDPLYTLEQMEKGQTYDELWNASQLQMVNCGWMHNYMRMYWAKKILEWSPNPATAFDYAVHLNDRYELDGRDPNGYAGIAWAITGKFDRPWFERPIFGTIRYMSGASTGKKFDSKRYIRRVTAPDSEPFTWV